MQTENKIAQIKIIQSIIGNSSKRWENLDDGQKKVLKKIWGVLTYKWRWQIAMNIPYLLIFALDRTVPAVHKFDLALIASITSKVPIPAFIGSWVGI